MTTIVDLPWTNPDSLPVRNGATGRKPCRRHSWEMTEWMDDGSRVLTWIEWCASCHKPKDPAASRRGRTNRSRGNAIERDVCHRLGIARVGQYGTPEDGGASTDWIRVQVKSGGAYPERIDSLLRAISTGADQLAGVVHVDAPGSAHKARRLITLDFDDFCDWFGK
jgi:hypothetical protein